MAREKPTIVWYEHDHADEYLLSAVHYLARAATAPVTAPLPAPSISATLFCALAAEAYVNVAWLRVLGEEEYQPVSRIPVRSKYFLVGRVGAREAWFAGGESVLEALDELFSERNRLVHAQPERRVLSGPDDARPQLHADLRNVAKWVQATADAASRLARSHGDLQGLERVAGQVAEFEALSPPFEPDRDGVLLQGSVRQLLRQLLLEDNEDFMPDDELRQLSDDQDPDWDIRGLDAGD